MDGKPKMCINCKNIPIRQRFLIGTTPKRENTEGANHRVPSLFSQSPWVSHMEKDTGLCRLCLAGPQGHFRSWNPHSTKLAAQGAIVHRALRHKSLSNSHFLVQNSFESVLLLRLSITWSGDRNSGNPMCGRVYCLTPHSQGWGVCTHALCALPASHTCVPMGDT